MLSNNAITSVAPDAFDYALTHLRHLDLSSNNLTVISTGLLLNTPALQSLILVNNPIVAIPHAGNHIGSRESMVGTPLQCETYGPVTMNCTCSVGVPSVHCGYVRCTQTPTGCEDGSIFNSSNCDGAPWSRCVTGAVPQQYYIQDLNTFLPITVCSELFGAGRAAYEVQPALTNAQGTATSDRICSVCSTCPEGFDTTPCTATSDAKCVRSTALTPGDIAAVTMALMILLAAAAVGVFFGRQQSRRVVKTKTELELTERLLGDVTDEKERVVEENKQMEQGWSIAVDDLAFGGVIGEGAFGRVFRGSWGHIAVAIKVLRLRLTDDPMLFADFQNEVKLMRRIRHPHLLTFYGAGIDRQDRAFLVCNYLARSRDTEGESNVRM